MHGGADASLIEPSSRGSTSDYIGGVERMAEQSANEILKRRPRTEMDDNTPDCRVVLIGRWALLRAYETK